MSAPTTVGCWWYLLHRAALHCRTQLGGAASPPNRLDQSKSAGETGVCAPRILPVPLAAASHTTDPDVKGGIASPAPGRAAGCRPLPQTGRASSAANGMRWTVPQRQRGPVAEQADWMF
ncbi:Map/Microtubule Affinity-Regulating Kinase 3 [Manis pentadactyla]|nr:Map/Microtubule Affinity-Regulating Kinase 3 [Manis pentadactyla]